MNRHNDQLPVNILLSHDLSLLWPFYVHSFTLSESAYNHLYFYRPPTKIREDNIFTGVCHSVWGREVGGWVGNYRKCTLPLLDTRLGHLPLPSPRHQTWDLPLLTFGGHHWRLLQTCTLEDLIPPSPTSSGGRRAVHILLACCLVKLVICWQFSFVKYPSGLVLWCEPPTKWGRRPVKENKTRFFVCFQLVWTIPKAQSHQEKAKLCF